jgi:hypothetical protein
VVMTLVVVYHSLRQLPRAFARIAGLGGGNSPERQTCHGLSVTGTNPMGLVKSSLIPRRSWAGVFPVTPGTLPFWHRKLITQKCGHSPATAAPADRLWFAALSNLIPRHRCAQDFPISAVTVPAWHRKLVAKKWDHSQHRRPGRPPTAAAVGWPHNGGQLLPSDTPTAHQAVAGLLSGQQAADRSIKATLPARRAA